MYDILIDMSHVMGGVGASAVAAELVVELVL